MSATGMDSGAVFTATALVCFLGTLVMALLTITTRSCSCRAWVSTPTSPTQKIGPMMYVLAVVFILKYVLI